MRVIVPQKKHCLQICSLYYQFQYYQELVEQLSLYYGRSKVKYDEQNFTVEKKGQPSLVEKSYQPTITFSTPKHITFLRLIYGLFAIRGIVIVFFKSATDTRKKRIYLGCEHWHAIAPLMESTVFFWTCIAANFVFFTLTNHPEDYQFLALFRMTDCTSNDKPQALLHPKTMGLKPVDYFAFDRFRRFAKLYYHSIVCSIVPLGHAAMIALYIKQGLYSLHPFWAVLWNFLINLWIYIATTSIYTFFLCFALTARYVQLKHRRVAGRLTLIYGRFVAGATNFRSSVRIKGDEEKRSQSFYTPNQQLYAKYEKAALRYNSVYRELEAYNRFWSFYLSNVFTFYVLIVAFVVYIVLFTTTTWCLNSCYTLVFFNHFNSMSAMIFLCGLVVCQNNRVAVKSAGLTAKFATVKTQQASVVRLLKLHNMNKHLFEVSQSGFKLSNGYLITQDTFRLLLINVVTFFLLTMNNVLM